MPNANRNGTADDVSLHKVVVLLAAILTKDQESLVDKVRTLQPLGLSTGEIAQASGATESGVRGTLTKLKKSAR